MFHGICFIIHQLVNRTYHCNSENPSVWGSFSCRILFSAFILTIAVSHSQPEHKGSTMQLNSKTFQCEHEKETVSKHFQFRLSYIHNNGAFAVSHRRMNLIGFVLSRNLSKSKRCNRKVELVERVRRRPRETLFLFRIDIIVCCSTRQRRYVGRSIDLTDSVLSSFLSVNRIGIRSMSRKSKFEDWSLQWSYVLYNSWLIFQTESFDATSDSCKPFPTPIHIHQISVEEFFFMKLHKQTSTLVDPIPNIFEWWQKHRTAKYSSYMRLSGE